jgi:hypothetical protein
VAENRPHSARRVWLLTISDLVALPVRSRRDRRYFKVRSGPGILLSVQHFVFPTGRAMALRILAWLPTSVEVMCKRGGTSSIMACCMTSFASPVSGLRPYPLLN